MSDKKLRLTKAELLARARKPLSRSAQSHSIPSPFQSLLSSAVGECSSLLSRDLHNVRLEYTQLVKEKQMLLSQCIQAKYERDAAMAQLRNLFPEAQRSLKRRTCGDDSEPSSFAVPNRSESPLPLPKLELSHVQAMYYQVNHIVHCCVCLMQKSGSRTNAKSPKSFPVAGLTLDDLVKHCVFDHPMSYADVTGLTIEQVNELQKRLKPLLDNIL